MYMAYYIHEHKRLNIPQVKIYSLEELWLQCMHIIGRDTPYTCANHAKSELQWQRMETFSATFSFMHHPRTHKLSWVDLGFRCMDTQVISNCTPSVISSLIKLLLSFVSYPAMLPNIQWYCFIRSNAAQHTMVLLHTQQCCPTYNGIVSYAAMLPNIQWYCFIRSNAAQHTMVLFHTQQCCPTYNGIVSYAAMLPNIQWNTQQCCPTYNGIVSYAAMLVQWCCFIRINAALHTMVLFHTQQCCPTYNGIVHEQCYNN